MKSLFVANWKMNLLQRDAVAFASRFKELFSGVSNYDAVFGIAPALSSFQALKQALGNYQQVWLGAQNVHWLASGAHTGEISAAMLKELGADFAIIGHSERRQFYGETNDKVALRAKAAINEGLTAIVCVGELEADFKAKKTAEVVHRQLLASLAGLSAADSLRLVVAYEPVWAIGTGLAATPEIADTVHQQIRAELCEIFGEEAGEKIILLYGGSTSPDNIAELCSQKEVQGALIGGASLKPESFAALILNGAKARAALA